MPGLAPVTTIVFSPLWTIPFCNLVPFMDMIEYRASRIVAGNRIWTVLDAASVNMRMGLLLSMDVLADAVLYWMTGSMNRDVLIGEAGWAEASVHWP